MNFVGLSSLKSLWDLLLVTKVLEIPLTDQKLERNGSGCAKFPYKILFILTFT